MLVRTCDSCTGEPPVLTSSSYTLKNKNKMIKKWKKMKTIIYGKSFQNDMILNWDKSKIKIEKRSVRANIINLFKTITLNMNVSQYNTISHNVTIT